MQRGRGVLVTQVILALILSVLAFVFALTTGGDKSVSFFLAFLFLAAGIFGAVVLGRSPKRP